MAHASPTAWLLFPLPFMSRGCSGKSWRALDRSSPIPLGISGNLKCVLMAHSLCTVSQICLASSLALAVQISSHYKHDPPWKSALWWGDRRRGEMGEGRKMRKWALLSCEKIGPRQELPTLIMAILASASLDLEQPLIILWATVASQNTAVPVVLLWARIILRIFCGGGGVQLLHPIMQQHLWCSLGLHCTHSITRLQLSHWHLWIIP